MMDNVTSEELEELSPWACIAFATRCVERVLPLFNTFWPDDRNAVQDALEYAKQCAIEGKTVDGKDAAVDIAKRLRKTMSVAMGADDEESSNVAFVSLYALAASTNESAVKHAHQAYGWSIHARNAQDAKVACSRAARNDFDHLLTFVPPLGWTEDTPAPPEFFESPLWPDGAPEGWPPQKAADE